jgi:hypothetical protein
MHDDSAHALVRYVCAVFLDMAGVRSPTHTRTHCEHTASAKVGGVHSLTRASADDAHKRTGAQGRCQSKHVLELCMHSDTHLF